jgi:4-diphosphocytidyl-2-C-methyl-D-erythritol kinase
MPALDILAPAKINLYLNVLGRRDNGYHELDSLVTFIDVGDRVRIEPAARFGFSVHGPYVAYFSSAERDEGRQSRNLAVRAARAMALAAGRDPAIHLTLTKNLPLAAGIGGGSADAAAVIWGLMELWGLKPEALPWLGDLAVGLGADVPVCLACRPRRMRGIGERLDDAPSLPETPSLLVNPGVACPTADVFRRFAALYSREAVWPDNLDGGGLDALLAANGNDLTQAAVAVAPEIAFVLEDLKALPGCHLARMSGSGATCFALFENAGQAVEAEAVLSRRHPEWWVRSGTLNRPARY